jgi:DNA-binding NarL/FixJ family response regulator
LANILVVDDERSIRISIREFLKDAGYGVGVAEDADQAMKMLGAEDFDIVLADIILPRITGVNLLKAIKEISPLVQVILMTGEPTIETATEAVRAGAFDYVAKPIGKAQLLRTVANAAKVKTLDDERRRLAEENEQHRKQLEQLVEERTLALQASNRALTVLCECGQALVRATSERGLPPDRRSSDDPAFIHLILATFESALQRAVQTTAEPSAVATDPELVEILSAREIEIVALLSERMRDKEIAARLSISPETVKSHLRNIYGKLEAHDRRQAVSRAIEVGILKPPG